MLVDKSDEVIGIEEKLKAHKEGKLHRAFSVLVFNSEGEVLLQKRAKSKYHCGGLWSNAACGHPRPDEVTINAAHRRLKEEMGFDSQLKEIFKFHYKAKFENGLVENEIDHVFVGKFDGKPKIDEEEVSEFKWISVEELKGDMAENPEKYTLWFGMIFERYLETHHINH